MRMAPTRCRTGLVGDRRVFLSLALFNQDKFDEAEESYKRAIQDAPSQPLARQVSSIAIASRARSSRC